MGREREESLVCPSRHDRINYLRGGMTIWPRPNLDMNRGNRANGTRFADENARESLRPTH